MIDRTEILEQKTYYQQFHHTVMGWYITISGFILAGLIASDVKDLRPGNSKWVIGASILANAVVFIFIIGAFDSRIKKLGEMLPKAPVDQKTFESHKDGYWACSGIGTPFFFLVIILLVAQNLLLWAYRLISNPN